MSARPDEPLTPEQTRAREALLSLTSAAPSPAFEARLRAQFTRGAFGERAPREGVRPGSGSWVVPALAWAACLAIAVLAFDRGPAWEVSRTSGSGVVLVGGRLIPIADTGALTAALAHGGRVRAPAEGELELVAPGQLAVHLAKGSDVVLPPAPGRWFRRAARAEVRDGEAFVTTGRGFHGASLTVATSEAMVEVVGTTFAVLRHGEGTCVCVMEGRVRVGAVGEAPVEVEAGTRRFCYPRASGRPSESAPILEYSEHALHELQSGTADRLGR